MYDNILYPTDGSDGAAAALEPVRDLAETYGATVHVLYVFEATLGRYGISGDITVGTSTGMVGNPDGGEGMVGGREKDEELRDRARAHGEEIVDQVASELDTVETVTHVEGGVPYEVIIDFVETNDVDIVVMGTHGRTGLDRYLLGSVTEKVVRTADVPVLTVRGDE
jgi:nucleotide-binding universal stress UspA family protein